MSEPLVDVPVTDPQPTAVTLQTSGEMTINSPAITVTGAVTLDTVTEKLKAGVADFEAALSFVESGVAQLGEAAKDELKELAKKYL